jgi:hypothetical protein
MPPGLTRGGIAGATALAGRLRLIRVERFGEDGISDLAREIHVPERTWRNYEGGVTVPGHVLLRFLDLTSAEPRWLLTGQGPRYRAGSTAETPH